MRSLKSKMVPTGVRTTHVQEGHFPSTFMRAVPGTHLFPRVGLGLNSGEQAIYCRQAWEVKGHYESRMISCSLRP